VRLPTHATGLNEALGLAVSAPSAAICDLSKSVGSETFYIGRVLSDRVEVLQTTHRRQLCLLYF
jgi:hypothetical protein